MAELGQTARQLIAKAVLMRPMKDIKITFREQSAWPSSESWASHDSASRLMDGRDWKAPAPVNHLPWSVMLNPLVRELFRALKKIPLEVASILDFGCGNGGFYPVMRSTKHTARWSYTGAEINTEMLANCRENYEGARFLTVGDVLSGGSEYDVVLASSVLEYVESTESFLDYMRALAKPYLVLSRVPVYERHSDQIVAQEVRWRRAIETHSMRIFNRLRLEHTIRQKGFEMIYRSRIWDAGSVVGTNEMISRYNFVFLGR